MRVFANLQFGKDKLPRAMNRRARPENSIVGTKGAAVAFFGVSGSAFVSLILSVTPIFGWRKSGDFTKGSRE